MTILRNDVGDKSNEISPFSWGEDNEGTVTILKPSWTLSRVPNITGWMIWYRKSCAGAVWI